MSSLLEKSLDEIIGENPKRGRKGPNSNRNKPNQGGRPRHGRIGKKPTHTRAPNRSLKRPNPQNKEAERLAGGEPYLRIRNLHFDLSEEDIQQLFSQVGPVRFCIIELDSTARPTGTAYAGFEDVRDCDEAISRFDGRRAAGQVISVDFAIPLTDRIQLGRGPSRGSSRKPPKSVKDLDSELDSYMSVSGDAPAPRDVPREAQRDAPRDLDAELNDYMSQGRENS